MELTERDFPAVETVSPGDVASTHRQVEIVPAGQPGLTFQLQVPQDWEHDPQSVAPPGDGSNWTPLAGFARKPVSEAEEPTDWAMVSVLWRKLEVEVPLDEWTALQMAALRVEVQSMRIWNDGAGPVIDVGGTNVASIDLPEGDTPVQTVVRAMVRADGQDVLAVWGISTASAYADASRDFLVAGASFRLTRPAQGGREELRSTGASNPDFAVSYPASWMHQAVATPTNISGKSALDLLLIEDRLLKGLIRVKTIDLRVVKVDSVERLIADATEELAQAGAVMQEQWAPLTDPVILSTADLECAYYSFVVLQESRFEVHFAVVQRPPLLFCETALVIPPESDAMLCLRGRRAYGIALASARPA